MQIAAEDVNDADRYR